MSDLFLNNKQKLWLWMKGKKLFSSVDLSKFDASHWTLRSGRTAREWCEGEHPRLRRLDTQEKLFRGLWKNRDANIAWYEVINARNKSLL